MKKILKVTIAAAILFSLSFTAQAQKFGYVNSAEILQSMPAVKQAEANLEALQKQYQKKGQTMLETFQKDYLAIQKKVERGELSPQEQQTEGQKLEARQSEIAKFEQEMMSQLEKKRTDLLKPIYDKINKAIEDVAKAGGYQMIFEQGVLLYQDASFDVSAKVKAKLGM